MIRTHYLKKIEQQFRVHSVCAILGPRQVGKTTLARTFIKENYKDNVLFFDLENHLDLVRLDNPMMALSVEPEKIVVIDEIQMRPELFPIIRVLVDESLVSNKPKRKFLILGSASRDLIRQSSETLAGRIGYIELPPFSLSEVNNISNLWLRGGFPSSYLANNEQDSFLWRQNYINTFLERDVPALGFNVPTEQIRGFWIMLAHYHGQIFNASEIGKSLGISDQTSKKYLDILIGTFMIRRLTPWFENIKKRQVRSPKIYFRDSGILHGLLSIHTMSQLYVHPRLGSFWEGFAFEELVKAYDITPEECFFWATHNEAELDLFILRQGKRLGFEIKYVDAPKITKSMKIAIDTLKLDHLYILYPGKHTFSMEQHISALGIESPEFLKM